MNKHLLGLKLAVSAIAISLSATPVVLASDINSAPWSDVKGKGEAADPAVPTTDTKELIARLQQDYPKYTPDQIENLAGQLSLQGTIPEMQDLIAQHLNDEDLNAVGKTCKDLNKYMKEARKIRKLSFNATHLNAANIEVFKKYKALHIKVDNADIETMALITQLGNVVELNLSDAKITNAGIVITHAGLEHIAGLTALTQLDLPKGFGIRDAGLAHFAGLTALTHLNLSLWREITDAGLVNLTRLTVLTHLDLSWCARITDAGLVHLTGLTALTHLNLRTTEITGEGLVHLAGLTALTRLDLPNGLGIRDAGLAHLAGLKALNHLELAWCRGITDAAFEHIVRLKSLTNLSLSGTSITDAGLAHLTGLTALTHVNIVGTGITVAALAQYPNLQAIACI